MSVWLIIFKNLVQAVVLCEYLTRNEDTVKRKRVIELGAGTGLVGIVAASLGMSNRTRHLIGGHCCCITWYE